jgi:hypothetical protein
MARINNLKTPRIFCIRSPSSTAVPWRRTDMVIQRKAVNFRTKDEGSSLRNALRIYSPKMSELAAAQPAWWR